MDPTSSRAGGEFDFWQRQRFVSGHPVVTRKFTILTPAVDFACSAINRRVWLRRTGAFLYAPPQTGKTWCARAAVEMLKADFPNAFVVLYSADEPKGPGSHSFLHDLTLCILPVGPKKGDQQGLLVSRLVTHIGTMVATIGGEQFVLIIDEMNLLNEPALRELAVIHNRLQLRNVAMTTIGFAQPEILHLRGALQVAKAHQLIGRFLSEPILFIGCSDAKGLGKILKAYDEDLIYPPGSGVTFTQFFLPLAYQSGFRLFDNAEIIWKEFALVLKNSQREEVPMEHLTRCVQYLLLNSLDNDNSEFVLTEDLAKMAVLASGLGEFFGSMGY